MLALNNFALTRKGSTGSLPKSTTWGASVEVEDKYVSVAKLFFIRRLLRAPASFPRVVSLRRRGTCWTVLPICRERLDRSSVRIAPTYCSLRGYHFVRGIRAGGLSTASTLRWSIRPIWASPAFCPFSCSDILLPWVTLGLQMLRNWFCPITIRQSVIGARLKPSGILSAIRLSKGEIA